MRHHPDWSVTFSFFTLHIHMSDIMKKLLKDGAGVVQYRAGSNVTGTVIDSNGHRILLDLPGGRTGIITKKEASGFGSEDNVVDAGSQLEAAVIMPENELGLVVMSLRRASQDMLWADLNTFMEEERTISVRIDEANKGGLIAKYKGMRCFLPVSQLMPMHYPRVNNADQAVIFAKLQEHIGSEFMVRVINVDRENGKVIISEKQAYNDAREETLKNLSVGDRVKGTVSGIVKFGIFVAFGGVEGLVHLSELDWGHVTEPGKEYNLGDEVEIMVIGIDGNKLSFSIKRLTDDPWKDTVADIEEGEIVTGKVSRWNVHGVFIDVKPDVQGFFGIDQFPVESYTELPTKCNLKEGMELKGEIYNINVDAHRLELKLL